MLDSALVAQLKPHFETLSSRIEFQVHTTDHGKQGELVEMLDGLSGLSDNLLVSLSDEISPVPRFDIRIDGKATGIRFSGVPGGHEFTSLVLAILNGDKKGKLPDEGVKQRVRLFGNKASLRTFVSLSCTNCPDVVQALNQIALISDGISHEFVDGELVPDEVKRLGIQGVPAVFEGDHLLHVGKADLPALLEMLESHLGVAAAESAEVRESGLFDMVVVGGGPAGVAAAVYAARKGQKTALVARKIGGQVNDTLGIENLISVPYTEGPKLSAALDDHLRRYPVSLFLNRNVMSVENGEDFRVRLQGNEVVRGAQLIVATGAVWRQLGVPGEQEYLGRGVAFCPHCDGPFFKGKKVAVIGGGNSGVEAAIDLAGICSEVLLVEFSDALKADEVLVNKLNTLPNIKVQTSARTTSIEGNGQKVTGLTWMDRDTESTSSAALDGVFVQIGLVPNSDMVKDVVERNAFGEIVVDTEGRTSVPGIYAAGDVTTVPYKQIVISMGDGAKAALAAFEDHLRSGAQPSNWTPASAGVPSAP